MSTLRGFLSDLGIAVLTLSACCSCAHPEMVAEALNRTGAEGSGVKAKGAFWQARETRRGREGCWL